MFQTGRLPGGSYVRSLFHPIIRRDWRHEDGDDDCPAGLSIDLV
ncbi:unnamed protein product [marine sediment metagenome]|uniref:Uncharacterized protein n=1 Tax=marine sediment metagenome TaxID=412755 RepID=X1KXU3_9ZZZZ